MRGTTRVRVQIAIREAIDWTLYKESLCQALVDEACKRNPKFDGSVATTISHTATHFTITGWYPTPSRRE